MISFLSKYGVSFTKKDQQGKNALHIAGTPRDSPTNLNIAEKGHMDCINAFLNNPKARALLSDVDNDSNNALHLAMKGHHIKAAGFPMIGNVSDTCRNTHWIKSCTL